MAFPRKLLNDGEDIVLDLRPHWIALARPFLLVVVALVLGVLAAVLEAPAPVLVGALVLILVALVYFGSHALGWSRTMFVLTTDRIISRRGVLTKSGIEIPLERINTVFFNQRLLERMVGAGDLALESASERGTQTFNNVRKPDLVQREIYVQMEANENRKFDRARGGPAASQGLSSVEQVERLHDLLSRGALTQEQFEAERARILGG
ncbi:PH domain-containing protein [Iamia majanohamensis]|uniref:PH domain-containing protein n=1 Tax=Iamia majanohamensis TaxID=467976 RepID=A0AAE9Y6U5_9ACTN|nr:PH domain-containing protein [Iamia majanohamensis]WCO65463.1 PH domain-containing protein [Iamia majanohamensis]